jgi:tRNA threonylcarbamoyladenosine biosynthesis protein TsaB
VTHSRRLLGAIDYLLSEHELDVADLDGLAVGLGPGSFTGLRIAMASMKGMATAAGTPLLGVSTLDGIALRCSGDSKVCVVLDARKQELYRRWYSKDDLGIYRPIGSIEALGPEQLAAEVQGPVCMVGDGLLSYGEVLREGIGDNLSVGPQQLHYPSAAAIGFLCCEQLHSGEHLDSDNAVPLYVRASDAELSLVKKDNSTAEKE